jgi:hypothetical protein
VFTELESDETTETVEIAGSGWDELLAVTILEAIDEVSVTVALVIGVGLF